MEENHAIPLDEEKLQDAVDQAKMDVSETLERYREALHKAKLGENGVPAIVQLEGLWSDLDGELRKIFLQLISSTLGSIQEQEMLAAKKENSERGV